MTIIDNEYCIPELVTEFKVLKVEYEVCESLWWLQYKDYEPFGLLEKGSDTLKTDEKLVGKIILAQISLDVEECLPVTKKEKSLKDDGSWLTFTGIYEDIILYESDGRTFKSYKLNSIFPIKISDVPEGAKIGDWVTVTGDPNLWLPR